MTIPPSGRALLGGGKDNEMKIILAPNSSRAASFEVACFRPFIDDSGVLCYGFNSPHGLSSASFQAHLLGALDDLHISGDVGSYSGCPRGISLYVKDSSDIQFD